MEIHAVVAVAENGVIGRDGGVPWHVPEDVEHYRRTVEGHPAIVGRRTFDSMTDPPGHPVLVLTGDRTRSADADGVRYVHSPADAAAAAAGTGADVAYVIGGQGVYEAFLPYTDRVVLSRIHGTYEGDRRFPELGPEWREVAREERDGFDVVEYVQDDPETFDAATD